MNFYFDNGLKLDNAGDLRMIDGEEDTTQAIKQYISTILGEWYENRALGLPYYDYLLGQIRPDIPKMRAEITIVISGVPGVLSVNRVEIDGENVTFEATLNNNTTIAGEVSL